MKCFLVHEYIYFDFQHDSTLYALMGALQVFNKIPVPYRACIMLELVETSYNNYSVQILYRNDSTQQPFPLAIPGMMIMKISSFLANMS